jgi:glycosyltransferase involved in cell wall biosynthesis
VTIPGGLSVAIIACNEAANLPRCLDSVAFADEVIVVVDDRSRDDTERIARARGARVEVHRYEGNLAQKNVALALATHAWVLALDADEALSPGLAAELRARLAAAPAEHAFLLNRITFHLGRWIRHGDFFPDWQLRLFRREGSRWQGVDPHGRVVTCGRVGQLEGLLEHYSYRDLADQVERIQEFSRVQARALRAEGRRVRARDLVLRPPARLLRAYLLKQGFRDGVPGLVIAVATAFHVFLKYAKLWELERTIALDASDLEPTAGKVRAGASASDPPAVAR